MCFNIFACEDDYKEGLFQSRLILFVLRTRTHFHFFSGCEKGRQQLELQKQQSNNNNSNTKSLFLPSTEAESKESKFDNVTLTKATLGRMASLKCTAENLEGKKMVSKAWVTLTLLSDFKTNENGTYGFL